MLDTLNNPKAVVWSHSDHVGDFYELPTDGAEMREVLDWLLGRYDAVKLWMGQETVVGAELFLACMPSHRGTVVDRLQFFEDEFSAFEVKPLKALQPNWR